MHVIRQASELETRGRKIAVAIGMFDGVHLGHQQVIRHAAADAEQHEGLAVVVTFDRHPSSVVAPARAPQLIQTLDQKLRAISVLSVDAALLVHFDEAFSQQTAEAFIRHLANDLAPLHSVTVGSSFTFGYKREGNVSLLRHLGEGLGFEVHGISAVALNGDAVSSTRIRETIRAGELDAASEMLGRPYTLAGTVVHGDGIGAKLGHPTANIETRGLVLPPNGVYAAHAYFDGQKCRAALNIGMRPTLENPAPQLRVEAHLLDFSGDLYGKNLELTFVRKLRDEKRFPSLDALREQIQRDIGAARAVF